ncbi:hypothetical protein G6F64_015259 [Rhizopus arrhizus]|uniref:Uncharacterized protein n=1 Tax=Rhizopus oryzae TaxID=64495 RepID=A0A9P7BHL0_RHIOR|nr:hypothetical protein G6F64_015259 [Rhizopus arrhizus]
MAAWADRREPAHEAAPDAFRPVPGPDGVHHGAADLGGAGGPGCGDGLLRRVQGHRQEWLHAGARGGLGAVHRAAPGLHDVPHGCGD